LIRNIAFLEYIQIRRGYENHLNASLVKFFDRQDENTFTQIERLFPLSAINTNNLIGNEKHEDESRLC
jgi:hypothetical protein